MTRAPLFASFLPQRVSIFVEVPLLRGPELVILPDFYSPLLHLAITHRYRSIGANRRPIPFPV